MQAIEITNSPWDDLWVPTLHVLERVPIVCSPRRANDCGVEQPPHKIKIQDNPPLGVQVSQVDGLLLAAVNARYRPGDLTGHERRTTARALVVEQDAVCQVHSIGL